MKIVIHYMKYVVTLDTWFINNDAAGWILENFGPRFTRWDFDPGFYMRIRFKHEEDAMAFKLRWL